MMRGHMFLIVLLSLAVFVSASPSARYRLKGADPLRSRIVKAVPARAQAPAPKPITPAKLSHRPYADPMMALIISRKPVKKQVPKKPGIPLNPVPGYLIIDPFTPRLMR